MGSRDGILAEGKPEADHIKKHFSSFRNSGAAAASFRRLGFTVLICLLSVSTPALAKADEIVGFYFHSWGVSSRGLIYFPHAFVTIDPVPGPEASPDPRGETGYPPRSFGFVSAKPGPILLLHHTRGAVIDSAKDYLSVSRREFAVRVTDAQYQSLLDAVSAWQAVEGDPYDLRRRNCVTFVAAMARAIGMDVGDDRTLDPLRFLIDLRQRNIGMITPDDAPNAVPMTVAASAN
jgi:hypothetical protein